MSSTSTRSIALVGAGGIGKHILNGFLNAANRPNVIVLTRSTESKVKALSSETPQASVPIISVDYTDVSSLTQVFKDHSIDIVVSTLSVAALQAQYALADAAKASGSVKLFVPSEWGSPSEGAKERGEDDRLFAKDEFVEYLKTIGLPYTRFYTGRFMSSLPWLVGMDVNGSVNILGKGETELSTTSDADIGGFVAHVLTSLPLGSPQLVNRSLRIQGQRITLRDVAQFYNKPIIFVSEGGAIPGKSKEERTFKIRLQLEAERGMTSTGWNRRTGLEGKEEEAAGSANRLWEGHVWQTVESMVEAN